MKFILTILAATAWLAFLLAPCCADSGYMVDTRTKAEQGNVIAEYNLGMMYIKGEGVARDIVEGAKWLRKAAEQGNAAAQYDLGWVYHDGLGVKRDYVETREWWSKAAEQG